MLTVNVKPSRESQSGRLDASSPPTEIETAYSAVTPRQFGVNEPSWKLKVFSGWLIL